MNHFLRAACSLLLPLLFLPGCLGGPRDSAGLKSASPDVRRERVPELGRRKPWPDSARKQVLDALTAVGQSDPDPLVRSAALASLRKQDGSAAEELALQLALDPDPLVRRDALKILSSSSSPRARAALLYAIRNDSSSDVRRQAARGLARFNDDEVLSLLIELLVDSDPGVVVASYRSLQTLSGLNLGARPAPWREWLAARPSVPPPSDHDLPASPPQPSPGTEPAPPASSPVAPAPTPAPAPDLDELQRFRR